MIAVARLPPARADPSNRPALSPRHRRVGPSDVLLPVAMMVWFLGVHMTNPDAMNDWGLLAALPVAFYIGVGLLAISIGCLLAEDKPSPLRLGLHLVALVVVLHGTVPLIFPETNYPWAYKHMGVVGAVNRRGGLDPTVDIYQNWPGFFALAAWFDKLAGVGDPLSYAKWAPVYFNLLLCLELAFVFRWLPLGRRERWLGLFLFEAGNWVGQDYFAPQALALVLCLAVFGMVLAWFQVERPPAPLRWAGRIARRLVKARAQPAPDAAPSSPPRVAMASAPLTERSLWARMRLGGGLALTKPPRSGRPAAADNTDAPLTARSRPWALVFLLAVFAVVVVTHQLSPYLVVAGIALMTAAGGVRPRWIVVAFAVVTIAYLVPHLGYLRSSHNLAGSPLNPRDILNALSNPFDNARSSGFDGGHALPGRIMTARGAPALIGGLWLLGAVGALRRLRNGRPMLILALLAGSPALLAFGQNYGGEAIFRIYLFSLPWVAALAASALAPRSGRWRRRTGALVAVTLSVALVLFMSAFYGAVELYRVRPGAVAASQYFYDHAEPGSVVGFGAPNFPGRLAANYGEFASGSTPPPLTTLPAFQGHLLGAADLPALSALYQTHVSGTSGQVYLALSADEDAYAEVLGFMPKGSIASLDRALSASHSPHWRVIYRNHDAVIYRYLPDGPGAP